MTSEQRAALLAEAKRQARAQATAEGKNPDSMTDVGPLWTLYAVLIFQRLEREAMTPPLPEAVEEAKAWAADMLARGLLDGRKDDDHLKTLLSTLQAMEEEKAELTSRLADYELTVTRVWNALGNPAYEDCGGRTIAEIVADQRSALAEALGGLEPFAVIAPHVINSDWRDGEVVHRQGGDGKYWELFRSDFRRASELHSRLSNGLGLQEEGGA